MYYILFNPLSGNGKGKQYAHNLDSCFSADTTKYVDVTALNGYHELFDELGCEDILVIVGGDGTLNRFVNDTSGINIEQEVLYYPTGSGNDFLHDISDKAALYNSFKDSDGNGLYIIGKYLKNLPYVDVNGKTYRFINGVGYGIDGYCCEVGDELRKTTDKPINYAGIAIKGLLFHYKPTTATVTVDGKTEVFKKAWLAPAMFGRFYGGGMMATPNQDRDASDRSLSTLLFYGSGKIKTLMIFPSIFKGEHISHTDCVRILSGKDISVEFDRPTALQIDGETIKGVTKYHAYL